jgi:predicted nucleic acid-binding protein
VIAIDTNLLIYAHRAGAPEHRAAQAAIERAAVAPGGWGIAQASVSEFWCQVTHPRYPGGPSTPTQAAGFLKALIQDAGALVLAPGRNFHERLLAEALHRRICGPRIFDLQIALAALDQGAKELWTHDRGFQSLPGLRVLDPLA